MIATKIGEMMTENSKQEIMFSRAKDPLDASYREGDLRKAGFSPTAATATDTFVSITYKRGDQTATIYHNY